MITGECWPLPRLWSCLALGVAGSAAAQSYPDKPIKMVVPFPPGGPIDTMARLVAQHLSVSLGQQVIVENRPGAGSTLGSRSVATADPDGYTLLFGSSGSLAVAPALYASLDFNPTKVFAPIASVSLLPQVFVVANSVPANTVAGIHRPRQGQSGQIELRRRSRHAAASAEHAVQGKGRHRHRLYPLQGRPPSRSRTSSADARK